MEFVEVMKKAEVMCTDFLKCAECPLHYPGRKSCYYTIFYNPEKAEKTIIDYFRRKENAFK